MHPLLVLDLHRARQADQARDLAEAQRRHEALRHLSTHPPSPSRARLVLARSLASLADRLATQEERQLRRV